MDNPDVRLGEALGKATLTAERYLNEYGTDLLIALLGRLQPGRHGKAFIPLKKAAGVPVAVELVIVRGGKVLLTYRDDPFFKGWHTPGTYMEQGESWQDAAQRCADKEVKAKIHVLRVLEPVNHPDSPRFHDVSVLLLCEIIEGEEQAGEWFAECPADLIEVHRPFWPMIERCLAGSERNRIADNETTRGHWVREKL